MKFSEQFIKRANANIARNRLLDEGFEAADAHVPAFQTAKERWEFAHRWFNEARRSGN